MKTDIFQYSLDGHVVTVTTNKSTVASNVSVTADAALASRGKMDRDGTLALAAACDVLLRQVAAMTKSRDEWKTAALEREKLCKKFEAQFIALLFSTRPEESEISNVLQLARQYIFDRRPAMTLSKKSTVRAYMEVLHALDAALAAGTK